MKLTKIMISAMLLAALVPAGHALAGTEGKQGVSFAQPQDGATVKGEFKVVMQVTGMSVEPAGKAVPGAGHYHLIVDGACIPNGRAVPKDATHMHFGKGQTQTMLKLAPGKHTLTLQFANGLHLSYGKAWCHTIHVTAE